MEKSKQFKISIFNKLRSFSDSNPERNAEIKKYKHISEVIDAPEIAKSNKLDFIFRGVWHDVFDLDEVKNYLMHYENDRHDSNYKRVLCAYDYKVYH